MRTIQLASISLFALMATGTLTPAAGQPRGGQRPPSEVLKRAPATPSVVGRAVERAVHPPAGAIRLGSISDAATGPATRPGTTASTATPTRPATMPKGILKTQNPRWSMEAVRGEKHIKIRTDLNRVREIPARQPSASAASRQPVSAPRPATVTRPASAVRVGADGRAILGSVSDGPAPRHAGSAITRHPQTAPLARTAARTAAGTAAKAAAAAGAKAVAGGAAGGVALYVPLAVIVQEFDSPGKTITDIKNGNINPNWTEIGASAVGGAAGAAAVTLGAAALPAVVIGAAATGGVMIAAQEINNPGKTSDDIKAMTGGAVDLKKAGADVNKVVDAGTKEVTKAAAKTATDIHKAAKGVLGVFGIK